MLTFAPPRAMLHQFSGILWPLQDPWCPIVRLLPCRCCLRLATTTVCRTDASETSSNYWRWPGRSRCDSTLTRHPMPHCCTAIGGVLADPSQTCSRDILGGFRRFWALWHRKNYETSCRWSLTCMNARTEKRMRCPEDHARSLGPSGRCPQRPVDRKSDSCAHKSGQSKLMCCLV